MEATKPVGSLDAAKTLAHYLDWNVSNLKMQKVLYMAQMLYMGKMSTQNQIMRLIDADFRAWKYGPVIPKVYELLKQFKKNNIEEWALEDHNIVKGEQGKFFERMATTFLHLPPLQLVRMTHHPKGAWIKTYDAKTRNAIIQDKDIIDECMFLYRDRGLWEKETP